MAALRVVPILEPEPGGAWGIRQILLENGHRPVEEFLDGLSEDEGDAFEARFRSLLGGQPFPNVNTLKRLRRVGNVWEIISGQNRIFGFRDGQQLVLTNGHVKKSNKTPPGPIATCGNIRDRYLEQARGATRNQGTRGR